MWLDIEHTDSKKYFTWDDKKFSDPLEMIQNLTVVGRKLVTIVDPHIKKDSGYWVYKDLSDLNLFVKNKNGNDYDGWCWPGKVPNYNSQSRSEHKTTFLNYQAHPITLIS